MRTLVGTFDLGDLVVVHPFLPHEEFQRLFSSASLMLFPSTAEGFGLPLVEAMRLGVPIVTSDIPPSREIAADVALFATSGSVENFTDQCRRIVEDAALRSTLARRGVERSADFTWQRCAMQTREVLSRAPCGIRDSHSGEQLREARNRLTATDTRQSAKARLKGVTPAPLLNLWRRTRYWVISRKNQTPEEVFSAIYRSNVWGGAKGTFYSGEGTRDPTIAGPYLDSIRAWLAYVNARELTVVDLGCGDFEVGRHL